MGNLKWKMSDIKAKGIHVSNGKGKKLVPEMKLVAKKTAVKRVSTRGDKEKSYIENFLKENGFNYELELRFAPPRRFRFDYCIPEKMVYIEYEGITGGLSRHTTVTGYTKDTEKYNLATSEGWVGFRYTALNYKDIELILEFLKRKQNK